MKQTYRVELPDGTQAKRTTYRTYTHVVAVQVKADSWDATNGKATAGDWFVWGWCGRLDLALKQQGAALAAGYLTAKIIPLAMP